MPRGIGRIKLPAYYRGVWWMESPPGVEVLKEDFKPGVVEYIREIPVGYYDVVVYINGGGVSGGEETKPREVRQSLNVVVMPGQLSEYMNRLATKASVAGVGADMSYANRLATRVSAAGIDADMSHVNKLRMVVGIEE